MISHTHLNSNQEYIPKIILVGNSGVGKTSLLDQLTNKNFFSYRIPTIGSNTLKIKKNKLFYQALI